MHIVAISGRKQAGKDTCYKFLREYVPGIHHFYYADALKRMAIDVLGCNERLVYGGDDEKNVPVEHLLWENFPLAAWSRQDGSTFIGTPNNQWPIYDGICGKPNTVNLTWAEYNSQSFGDSIPCPKTLTFTPAAPRPYHWGELLTPKAGAMTVREVLQFWGTDIFRKAYADVWTDACLRAIAHSDCELAVITDCRFPNEVDAAQSVGGKVVRLTRTLFPDDTHASEVSLDRDRFDWRRFDAVIYNEHMDVYAQCRELANLMSDWGMAEPLTNAQVWEFSQRAAA